MNKLITKVESIGDKALDWLILNLDYFKISHHINQNFRWNLKVFVELVFLVNYLIRKNAFKNDLRLKKIVDFINEELKINDFEYFINRDPDGLSGLAIFSEFKEITNPMKNEFKNILVKYSDYGIPKGLKKIPFRIMDLKYSYERSNVTCNLPSYEELFDNTVAGKGGNYIHFNTMDIYSITHTIFYISDMGFENPNKYISLERIEDLFSLINKLMVFSIMNEDMDILGELIMCLFYINFNKNSLESKAILSSSWEYIGKMQCEEGNIHSPTYSIKAKKVFGEERDYEFIHSYHTTLVVLGAVITSLEFSS